MRIKEMEHQDVKNKGPFDIKQLEENFLNQAALIWSQDREEIITSILMGGSDSEDPGERIEVQQHHNARHALWFVYMAVCDVIGGTEKFSKAITTNKIIAHLICLKEFINSHNLPLKLQVKQLSEAVLSQFPDTPVKWTHFLYHHWFLIRAFAHEFKSDETCFSLRDYERVSDILHGRRWMRLWWLKERVNEGIKCFRRLLRLMSLKGPNSRDEGTNKTETVAVAS